MSSLSAFAPGRVELLGNHTDYNGGVVLSAALELGITASGSVSSDGAIRLRSAGFSGEVVLAPGAEITPNATWADYPLGVISVFRRAGFPVGGVEVEFSSTLPLGAGLSSSASIEVATASLLMKLFGIELPRLEVAKLCRRAENEFVGVNCGLLDQVSSIFGKKNHAVFLDCRAESVENVPLPAEACLLITDSSVKHALTGGEYNERREQCFEAAHLLGVSQLRDTTMAKLLAADLPEMPKRRAMHVVGENERVFAAIDFLRAGDLPAFGKLMTASHQSSMDNFENSTDELDALVRIAAARPGVYGSRLTGGGFGGATVSLVAREKADEIANAVRAAYLRETGHTARTFLCAAGDGALSE